jgi:2-phospho-L-lactate guanylyltransferase
MLALGDRAPIVIAPDAQDEGTNALLLSPPDRMPTCFGRRGSFRAHLDRARALGLEPAVLRAPSLAFDIDSADDLARLKGPDRGALRG